MKNKFSYIYSSVIIVSALLFSFQKPENHIVPDALRSAAILEASSPLRIKAHALSPEESRFFVPAEAVKQGYQVMLMSVENTTPFQYELKQSWVDLSHAEKKKLMKSKRIASLTRSVFFKIIGFFFWPAAIPGAVDTLVTMKREHSLKNKIHAALLKKEGEIVLPYSMIQRYLIITDAKLPKEFKMQLLNCHTQRHENYTIEVA